MYQVSDRAERDFIRILGVSLALHVVVLGVAAVSGKFTDQRKFISPIYTVELVKPAPAKKARRAVASPIKKKKAPARKVVKTKAPDSSVKVTSALKALREKREKEKEKELLEKRIEDLREKEEEKTEDIEDLRERVRSEDEKRKRFERLKAGLASKKEAVASPPSGALKRDDLDDTMKLYHARVMEKVEDAWVCPGSERTKRKLIFSIKVDRSGRVLRAWIEESSGDRVYDDCAMKAVKKAEPMPRLPEGYSGDFYEFGFRFSPGS